MARAVTIAQNAGAASVVEWAKLALRSPRARVMRLARILFDATDQPLALEEVVLPLERFPGLSLNDGGDVPDIIELAQRHGLALGPATERLSIVRATKDVASHLQIASGTEVLKLNRIVETVDGAPVEWRVSFRKF